MSVKILKGDFIETENNTYNKDLIKFPYECDHFQKHSFKCIDEGSNVLITAHTGSGKTVVAIYAIANCIKNGKKVVYTSPIKSLSNEKYKDFRDRFNDKFKEETGLDISIGLLTGDNKINPDGNLLIMTAEILRNSLFKSKTSEEKSFIDDIGCIIMDEVHFINDQDRGKVWEETIILANQNIQLVMLSATIDKPDEFANWIGSIRDKQIYLIPTSHRVVPLDHYIYINNNIHKIMDTSDKYLIEGYRTAKNIYLKKGKDKEKINFNIVQELVKYLKENDLLQTIFFSFSRKNCETYAQNIPNLELVTDGESKEIHHIWSKYLYKDEEKYIALEQYNNLKSLVQRGIAFHHSGLIPILKEIVEILFQKGLVKILFATETFAVGVNMPTRSVVFTELEKYTNRGKRFLNTAEYKQMSGRAGRRGIDTVGYSIILPFYNFPDEDDIKSVLTGKVPKIESKFNIDYEYVLKTISNKLTDDNEILGKSLREVEKNLVKSGILKELKIINDKLETFSSLEDELNMTKNKDIQDLRSFVDKENKLKKYEDMGMTYKKDKSFIKQSAHYQKELKTNSELKKIYDDIKEFELTKIKKSQIEDSLNYLTDENIITIDTISKVLLELNFLSEESDKYISSQKGIIAGNINECNPILFTEMIFSDMFNDLNEVEIVTLLSIFLEDKNDDDVFKGDIYYASKLIDKFTSLEKYIDKIASLENKYNYHSPSDYWKITLGSMDATYLWASGESIVTIKNEGLIGYEGNFIKNMTKLYNIVNDFIDICNKIGKVELLPKLEKIPQLIIRDIVNLNSLYFI